MKNGQKAENGNLVLYGRDGKPFEIIFDQDGDEPEYYRIGGGGNRIKIDIRQEDLVNEFHRVLWPIDNLRQALWDLTGDKDDEAPAIYFLLEKLSDEASDRMSEICDALEKKLGDISFIISDQGYGGLRKGELLDVIVEPIEPPEVVNVKTAKETDEEKREKANALMNTAKTLQDKAQAILAELKDKPAKKRKAA